MRLKIRAEPEERGTRLDMFLARHFGRFTRSHIQALNRSGSVLVEGRPEKSGYRMRGGETVEVEPGPLPHAALEPQPIPLKVVYEDEDLAVIDKQAGLSVHPGNGTGLETLVHALLFRFKSLSSAGGETRPGIVHRIDKWTSGLLIVAKTDEAHVRLSRAFQERKVEKRYIALVHGKMAKASGQIDLNIGRHRTVRTRMSVQKGSGRVALSSYRTLKEIRGFSLLEVEIKTGRTHQIRVHLSAIGHPVVGDNVYGEARYAGFSKKFGAPGRYFLHAAELVFAHPRTGEMLAFHSPLPEELENLLKRIGK